jgi:hypothetical protein
MSCNVQPCLVIYRAQRHLLPSVSEVVLNRVPSIHLPGASADMGWHFPFRAEIWAGFTLLRVTSGKGPILELGCLYPSRSTVVNGPAQQGLALLEEKRIALSP